MLGPPKPRRLDQPIAVSLEDLVPRDPFYRHVEAKLDVGFVSERKLHEGSRECLPRFAPPAVRRRGASRPREPEWWHGGVCADVEGAAHDHSRYDTAPPHEWTD